MCLSVKTIYGSLTDDLPFTAYTRVLHHYGRLPAESSPLFSTAHSEAQLNYNLFVQLFWGRGVYKQRATEHVWTCINI